jgi:hypothetical protein
MLLTARFRLLGLLLAAVGAVAFDAHSVTAAISHNIYPAGRASQVADTARPKALAKRVQPWLLSEVKST